MLDKIGLYQDQMMNGVKICKRKQAYLVNKHLINIFRLSNIFLFLPNLKRGELRNFFQTNKSELALSPHKTLQRSKITLESDSFF